MFFFLLPLNIIMVTRIVMFKIKLYVMLILYMFVCADGKRRKRETASNMTPLKWTYQHRNLDNYQIDVQLRNLSSYSREIVFNTTLQEGIMEILVPSATNPLYLCYPESNEEYRSAYIFSHVVCRQLGFMSFVSFNKKEIFSPSESLQPLYGLRPSSHKCTGQEHNVSYCEWNEVTIADCSIFAEISCGECRSIVPGTSGIMKSPGYPLAHLYDITCEWNIVAPDDHSIILSTKHFEKTQSSISFCGYQKPYLEIVYGSQHEMTIERYCNLEDVRNLSIPSRDVKIKIFTGFFSPDHVFQSQVRGMAIYFEAQASRKPHIVPWKAIFITLFILIFLTIVAIFHYCKKFELCYTKARQSVLPTVNVPTEAELNRAYEFQRCRIQAPLNEKKGLRLRSNGSGEKSKGFMFASQARSNFLSADNLPTTYEVPKACPKHPIHDETPRTIIPKIVLNDGMNDEEKENPIDRVKTTLLDRFSNSSAKEGDVSISFTNYSPVFFPPPSSFQIYQSVSSDSDEKPPPYQAKL